MATEERDLSQLDLRFVDHVETKIQSPEKEAISPTKALIKSSKLPQLNGTDVDEIGVDSSNKIKDMEGKDSKSHDSGLDSSNSSSETSEEHFIDRQESYTDVSNPEVLTSPNKTVNKLFNFLNSESSQSLDALNNNSEEVLENLASEKPDINGVATTDVYLGKEVDLHGNETNEAGEAKGKENNDASLNLYWYTSNLDVDVAELEAFKTAQDETKKSANVTSNLEVTIGNGYYKTKNIEVELDAAGQNVYKSETKFNVKSPPVKRDSWSPAFESASSRIIGLASELKSDPKVKKNRENETIRDSLESKEEKHPWGLDVEDKVRTELTKEVQDELPDISVLNFTESKGDLKSQEDRSERIESTENKGEYVTDAVGYMELNSKPTEQTVLTETNENKIGEMKEDTYSEDVADAVGYMELNDKPVEEILKASEQSTLKSSESATNDVPYDRSEVKSASLENQIKQFTSSEESSMHFKQVDQSEDVADAVGYMELSDRPVTEPIKQTVTSTDQSDMKTSVQPSQGVYVEGSISEDSVASLESRSKSMKARDTKNSGIDVPDAANIEMEKIEQVSADQVNNSVQISRTEEKKVQEKPFEPFNIKRKYQISSNSEDQIQVMGGMFLESETFTDEYLDDKNYSLLLSDSWLRLRNKKFEMKINAAFGIGPNKSPSCEIITNENEIQEMLMKKYAKKLEQKRKVSERHLDVLIDGLDISLFVTFGTTRRKYQIDQFVVTLYLTNFGFQVGEIEVLANSLPEMMSSLAKMDKLAEKLGFRPLQSN